MAKPKVKPALLPLPNLLVIKDREIEAELCKRIAEFEGVCTTLESALGALVVGQHLGTRVLRMIHSPSTFRKYEEILGLRFEDHCPDRTHLSRKNVGIKIVDKVGGFWDVVMGRKKVEHKGWIDVGLDDDPNA